MRIAKEAHDRGRLGRLRAVTLLGVADLGDSFLTTLERSGVWLSDGLPQKRFNDFIATFLEELDAMQDGEWLVLKQRMKTYCIYHELTMFVAGETRKSVSILSQKPRFILKKLLAIASLTFLSHYLRFDLPDDLLDRIGRFGRPEHLGKIISLLLALANSYHPLDSLELGFPAIGDLSEPAVWDLLDAGKALLEQSEIAKQISVFGFSLSTSVGTAGLVYCLVPPTQAFEYALRLGYIRTELGSGGLNGVDDVNDSPQMSILAAAETFAKRWGNKLYELRDPGTEFRRVRVKFPMIPDLLNLVTSIGYFEEINEREKLAQEFMWPIRVGAQANDTPFPLTKSLSLDEYRRLWKILQFMALVDIAATRECGKDDLTVLINSAVRVTKDRETLELFSAIGISEQKTKEFLELVSADVHKFGYYDLQYRPLLKIAQANVRGIKYEGQAETISLPALIATANIFRNVQVANKLRFSGMGDAFVTVVASILGDHFDHVTTNRPVKNTAAGATDIDVVVLQGTMLYLFECKHSVFPTEPHEMRDIWEDIEKGVRQLKLAHSILRDPSRLKAYLNGWFPGLKMKDADAIQIKCCVLCSQRVFSGMEHDGIAIRDYASLSKMAGDGTVGLRTSEQQDEVVFQMFRLTEGEGFCVGDLDNYLSRESKFFSLFAPFMRPIWILERIKQITIARETYVFEAELDEWLRQIESVGGKRLPEERKRRRAPVSLESMIPDKDADFRDKDTPEHW